MKPAIEIDRKKLIGRASPMIEINREAIRIYTLLRVVQAALSNPMIMETEGLGPCIDVIDDAATDLFFIGEKAQMGADEIWREADAL